MRKAPVFLSTDSLECSTQHHRESVQKGGSSCYKVEKESSKAKGHALSPAHLFYFPGRPHPHSSDSSFLKAYFPCIASNPSLVSTFLPLWVWTRRKSWVIQGRVFPGSSKKVSHLQFSWPWNFQVFVLGGTVVWSEHCGMVGNLCGSTHQVPVASFSVVKTKNATWSWFVSFFGLQNCLLTLIWNNHERGGLYFSLQIHYQ